MWKVRVPVGKLILELPAGMLDNDKGDIVGTAVREVSLSLLSHLGATPYFLKCFFVNQFFCHQE